jgi:hypothetical protein
MPSGEHAGVARRQRHGLPDDRQRDRQTADVKRFDDERTRSEQHDHPAMPGGGNALQTRQQKRR